MAGPEGRTREDPWCIVDEQHPQRLGVVCFEAFDDEFDGLVFLEESVVFCLSFHE